MGQILLAVNRIVPGTPLPAGHLQIVNSVDGVLREIEVQAALLTGWNFELPTRQHDTEATTVGYGQSGFYDITAISTGVQDADEIWSIASQIAEQYNFARSVDAGAVPQYNLVAYNSNSYVNSIFQAVGLDLNAHVAQLEVGPVSANHPLAANLTSIQLEELNSATFSYPGVNESMFDRNEYLVDLTITGGAGANFIRLGFANDTIRGLGGTDTLFGQGGNDRLSGGSENDLLYGGDGNDQIHGGTGVDSIYGGAGHDTIIFSPLDSAVHIDIRPGRLNSGAASREVYDGVEAFVGTNGNDSFSVGNRKVMFAAGGAGGDVFSAKEYGATMVAFGGAGTDSFRIDQPGLVLVLNIPGVTEANFSSLSKGVLEMDGKIQFRGCKVVNSAANAQVAARRSYIWRTGSNPSPIMRHRCACQGGNVQQSPRRDRRRHDMRLVAHPHQDRANFDPVAFHFQDVAHA
jgi:hypothetical protein